MKFQENHFSRRCGYDVIYKIKPAYLDRLKVFPLPCILVCLPMLPSNLCVLHHHLLPFTHFSLRYPFQALNEEKPLIELRILEAMNIKSFKLEENEQKVPSFFYLSFHSSIFSHQLFMNIHTSTLIIPPRQQRYNENFSAHRFFIVFRKTIDKKKLVGKFNDQRTELPRVLVISSPFLNLSSLNYSPSPLSLFLPLFYL